MKQQVTVFFWGLLISFLGALPLGTGNVVAVNLSVKEGSETAMLFALGNMLAEVAIARLMLFSIAWIHRKQKIFRFFEWLTVFFVFALSIGSFGAAVRMDEFGSAIPGNISAFFLLGAFISITNPLHIPFWFGWSTVLINKNILYPTHTNNNIYVAGIGVGTMLGFAVYVYGGNYLVQALKDNQNILNWIIGAVLLLTAVIMLYKILNKKIPVPVQNS